MTTIERTDVVWLEARGDYTLHELIEMSGLPPPVLDELIECGALPAHAAAVETPAEARSRLRFEAESIVLARAARRLREHFELDPQGLAVAVSLLRRVRKLEAQLGALAAERR